MAKAAQKPNEQNTEEAQPGAQASAAPISEPAGTSAPAPVGEIATDLPGTDTGAIVDEGFPLITPATADAGFLDVDLASTARPGEITVICHAPDGRRRLGRRWPAGKAFVPLADLSDADIELLRADPQFSVILPSA